MKKSTKKPTKKSKGLVKSKINRLVGRPSKYKKEYAKQLIEYFNVEPYKLKDGRLVATRFPTLERFSIKIGVFVDTLNDWAMAKKANGKPKHPEFLRAYKHIKALQKDILVINGLQGLYQSNFCAFVATNFTDMADRKEIDATSGGEKIMGFNYIVPSKPNERTDTDNSDFEAGI